MPMRPIAVSKTDRRVENGRRRVAVVQEAVDPEIGEMDLAIPARDPLGAQQHGRVVVLVAVCLQQSHYDMHIKVPAEAGDSLRARAGNGLADRQRLLEAVEHVSGQSTLGKDDQPCAFSGGCPGELQAPCQVPLLVEEPGLHLHRGDLQRRAVVHIRGLLPSEVEAKTVGRCLETKRSVQLVRFRAPRVAQ